MKRGGARIAGWLGVAIGAGIVCAVTSVAAAGDLEALLARPMSPGTLGLMLTSVKDPRVQTHWRAALFHASPQVRAAAARLLFANGIVAAVPELSKVVATDADRAVVLEAARATLVLGPETAVDDVLAAARRLDDGELAIAVAHEKGAAALGRLDLLRAAVESRRLRRLVSLLAAGGDRELGQIADASLKTADAELWRAVLEVAYDESIPLSAGHIELALASPSDVIRAYAWWHVALLAARKALPPTVPAEPPAGTDSDNLPANLAFGRELAARVASHSTPSKSFPVESRDSGDANALPELPAFATRALQAELFQWLTKTEIATLDVKPLPAPAREARPIPTSDYQGLRTVAALPDGFVADVLKQTKCEPKGAEFAGAIVQYSPRKHLEGLQWLVNRLKAPCTEASRIILAAALLPAPPLAKQGARYWVMLPMHEEFLRCLADPAARKGRAERVGDKGIRAPTKTRDVRPAYPAAAQIAGRQGIVIIQAEISPGGCVSSAEVVRGAATDLDLEALRAVTGWAFTPTLLNGQPVPVEMTVTVSFALQY